MERLSYIQHQYSNSEQKVFQGSVTALEEQKQLGFYPTKGGKGSYRLVKPAHAIFYFQTETGEQVYCDMKPEIKNFYGKSRVTENLVNNFAIQLREKNVDCWRDESGDVHIKESR